MIPGNVEKGVHSLRVHFSHSKEGKNWNAAEWMALHDISQHGAIRPSVLEMLLREATKQTEINRNGFHQGCGAACYSDQDTHLSAATAWNMVVDSLVRRFPLRREQIQTVAAQTRVSFEGAEDGKSVAYTIPGDGGRSSFIRVPFGGKIDDVLTLAHEFGHALQADCAATSFVPPIDREIAAFIAELCFVENLRNTDHQLFDMACKAWQRNRSRTLHTDGSALFKALRQPKAAYEYRLNYPLARIGAERAVAWLPDKLLWRFFDCALSFHALFEQIPWVNERSLDAFDAPAGAAKYRALGGFVTGLQQEKLADPEPTMPQALALGLRCTSGYESRPIPALQPLLPGWLDRFAALGLALEVLATSSYHSKFRPRLYFKVQVNKPLSLGQARFYMADQGRPTGMVTWAWLSEHVEAQLLESGGRLSANDWQSGDRLFFYDWISERCATPGMMRDLIRDVFADHRATSIRRADDGSIKKICRWMGSNVARRSAEAFHADASAQRRAVEADQLSLPQ